MSAAQSHFMSVSVACCARGSQEPRDSEEAHGKMTLLSRSQVLLMKLDVNAVRLAAEREREALQSSMSSHTVAAIQ